MEDKADQVRWLAIFRVGNCIYREWPKDYLGKSIAIQRFQSEAEARLEAERLNAVTYDTLPVKYMPHTHTGYSGDRVRKEDV